MTGNYVEDLRPVALAKDGSDGLIINWSDGHQSVYSWRHLRDNCPCAGCKKDSEEPPDPFRILKASDLAPRPPLAPSALVPVGHYAYKIAWNDGHDTGIYTLENLRALCLCSECRRKTGSPDLAVEPHK
jgi:DUF971 family protein